MPQGNDYFLTSQPKYPTMENLAGLYFHIPFCQCKCAYCDFYSQANSHLIKPYIKAICKELRESRDFLAEATDIATIYFGGGTPSLLQTDDFQEIFREIESHFNLSHCEEITLEANPDNLSDTYLESLRALPFNRLSIGIQSFQDQELAFIQRRHTAQEAISAVQRAQAVGFHNISIDLMFGLPLQTMKSFSDNIDKAIALKPQHISAYMLGLEPEVPLARSLEAGLWQECEEETAIAMYQMLADKLQQAGYEHYEISNFALPGFRSRHNSSYWHGRPYLGLGPSAHSFDGKHRRWNASNITDYLKGVFQRDEEILSPNDQYNDFILTRLRTCEGFEANELTLRFGKDYTDFCLHQAEKFLRKGELVSEKGFLRIHPDYYFVSDNIIRDLLRV